MPDHPADQPTDAPESAASWTRRRLGNTPVFFVVGVLAAAVFTIGWGYALMSYGGSSGVAVQVVTWNVESSQEAEITFQVNSDAPAECVVTARDSQHVVVGQTSVEVESGIRDVTATVDTIREATAVEVGSCREQSPTK